MISVDLPKTVMCGSMIQADPGSRSTGSDPEIHFRDPRACLVSRLLWRANLKAFAVGSMQPKAAGSGERTSVGVMSGTLRFQISSFFGNLRSWMVTTRVLTPHHQVNIE